MPAYLVRDETIWSKRAADVVAARFAGSYGTHRSALTVDEELSAGVAKTASGESALLRAAHLAMSQSRRCLEARVWPTAEDKASATEFTVDHASSWTYFVAGIIAGSAGAFVGHPFETVKLSAQQVVTERQRTWLGRVTLWARQVARRLLLGSSAVAARPSSLEVAKQLIKDGGVGRLYEGFVSPVTFGGIEKSVRFGVQSTIKDLCVEWPSTPRIVASGLVSGFASALLTTPIDQAKVNRQLRVPSTVSTAYAALPCAIANYIFYSPFYFLCYDRLRTTLLPSDLLAGGFTGAVACALFFPFDTIKTVAMVRVAQTASEPKRLRFESPLIVMDAIYRVGGRRAFFTGVTPAVLRAFPAHATVFLVYTSFLASCGAK